MSNLLLLPRSSHFRIYLSQSGPTVSSRTPSHRHEDQTEELREGNSMRADASVTHPSHTSNLTGLYAWSLASASTPAGGIQTIGSLFSVVTSNVRNVSFERPGSLSSRIGGAILLPSWRILQAASQEASAKTLIPYRPWYPVKGREGIRLWSAAIFLSVSSRSLIRNLALEGRQSDQSSWNDHGKQG